MCITTACVWHKHPVTHTVRPDELEKSQHVPFSGSRGSRRLSDDVAVSSRTVSTDDPRHKLVSVCSAEVSLPFREGCGGRSAAFRARLLPQMKHQVSKTSISYETSSKREAPSLQNERCVRDFLQQWSATNPKRPFTCISRTRHARSPQRVAPDRAVNALSPAFRALDAQRVARDRDKSHSRLYFVQSTRTIPAEGCPGPGQIALSPAFRAVDTHDFRRGLSRIGANPTLACISPDRRARSPQRVVPDRGTSHSRPSAAFRAVDTHDPRRGLSRTGATRTLACISRTRHARSRQRVVPDRDKSHSRLHFAHSTRTISAEGCPRQSQIALSPAFRALDTHDLRRGLPATKPNRTLACISRTRHARSPQRVAFRGGPAALPPALREKVKKSQR